MVKRTLEAFACDICEADAERYTVGFPDGGVMALDRCGEHNGLLLQLREEKGQWSTSGTKTAFKVSTIEDIKRELKG